MLKLLHWSDPHGSFNLVSQTQALADMMGVDANICTGDLVPDYYEQDISSMDLDDTLFILGNHDVILRAGTNPAGYEWDKKPTMAQAYDKYFRKYAGKNFTMNENQTWWYKTWPDKKIIMLGLDVQATGADATSHMRWLGGKLQWAKDRGYALIVLGHAPVSSLSCSRNSWLDRHYYTDMIPDTSGFEGYYPFMLQAYDAVCDWADTGGNVAMWLTGHEHADSLFVGGKASKFPVTSVCSIISDRYGDLYRGTFGNVDAVCANYMEYVPEESVLKIYRLGAGSSRSGTKRRCCVWGYRENAWIEWLDREEGR